MTRQEQREAALSALHEATQGFMAAPDTQAVVEHGVETAKTVLDQPLNGIWLLDRTGERLELAAATEAGLDLIGEAPTYEAGESLSWAAYEAGEVRVYDDLAQEPGRLNSDGFIASEIILPLRGHGVMNIGALEPNAFDEVDRSLASILADTITTALDRAEREEELEATVRRLDQFASMVAHDLRNPLAIATGRLELFRETGDAAHLDEIEGALQRIDELTGDLLALARSDGAKPTFEALSIGEVARESWELIDTESASLAVEDGTVTADASQLKACFENLFRNAVGHGGDDVTVSVGPLDGGGFYVGDTGSGIPRDEREHVFEHGYSSGYGGSGVGLTIVRRIAEAHDWDVELTESDAGGARFEFHAEA